ncbi:MAG: hypothetical protein Q4Q06_04905 [Bacteroidota bacterium]|nr:hypothetical protein [Bacteroidota bacterium]
MKNSYIFGNKVYYFLFVVCTIVITTLLLLPANLFSNTPKIVLWKHSDKVVHFLMFFCESWLLFRSIELRKGYKFSRISKIVVLSISIFGLFTEILQGITYNTAKRNFSLADLFFDILASVVAVLVINFLHKRIKKNIPF